MLGLHRQPIYKPYIDNVIVKDENGGQYAEIGFMPVYFNQGTENVLNSYFD